MDDLGTASTNSRCQPQGVKVKTESNALASPVGEATNSKFLQSVGFNPFQERANQVVTYEWVSITAGWFYIWQVAGHVDQALTLKSCACFHEDGFSEAEQRKDSPVWKLSIYHPFSLPQSVLMSLSAWHWGDLCDACVTGARAIYLIVFIGPKRLWTLLFWGDVRLRFSLDKMVVNLAGSRGEIWW